MSNVSNIANQNYGNKMLINFESVCRCCLGSGSLKSIFSEMITKTTVGYDKMIESVCSVPVTKNDGFSSQICVKCIPKLSASYKFKQKCIESLTELKNLMEQICPTLKLEPKVEESEFQLEPDETSQCNIIIDQLQCLQYFHNENNDLNNEKDNNANSEIVCYGLNKDTKKEKHEDDQTCKTETGVEVDTIIEDPGLSEIQEKYIKKEEKHFDNVKGKGSQMVRIKNKKIKLTCDVCGKTYLLLKRLEDHINYVHQGRKPYHCPICNKDFANEEAHRDTHKTFSATCNKCGQKFTKKTTYKTHIEIHENREYKCMCGKTFKLKSNFNSHKRLVHGPKRYYSCHICPKTVTSKGSLDDHIRNHSDERPFKCEFCVMTFRTNKVRLQHIKQKHSNVRAYKCNQCDKQFKTQSVLIKHRYVHAERRFACRICKQPFGRLDNRNVHERSVHGLIKEEAKTLGPA